MRDVIQVTNVGGIMVTTVGGDTMHTYMVLTAAMQNTNLAVQKNVKANVRASVKRNAKANALSLLAAAKAVAVTHMLVLATTKTAAEQDTFIQFLVAKRNVAKMMTITTTSL